MITDFYEVTISASEDPVTLVEAKAWLKVTTDVDNDLITALITAVTSFGEKFCNRLFVERELDCFFNGLDSSKCELFPFLQIRRAILLSVEDVSIFSDGSYVAFTDYKLREQHGFSRLIFQNGISDANPDSDAVYPIRVQIKAGYGAASVVPEDIKTALKAHINFLYENRGDAIAEGKLSMPLETKSIYSGKYRILNTYG